MQDLHFLFGSLSGMSISEIGPGYGGQAIHILLSDVIAEYIFYDLDEPSQLALKYISKVPFELSIHPKIGDFTLVNKPNLVISNYAFSELTREIQEIYFQNIIRGTAKGYFIYNHIRENPEDSMSAFEFAARIPGACIYQEVPLTYPGNFLIVWGHNEPIRSEELFKKVDF